MGRGIRVSDEKYQVYPHSFLVRQAFQQGSDRRTKIAGTFPCHRGDADTESGVEAMAFPLIRWASRQELDIRVSLLPSNG